VGVPEVSINPGDSFTWQFSYDSENANGDSPISDLEVTRGNLLGIPAMDLNPSPASLAVEDGHVVSAFLAYHFSDPRYPIGDGYAIGLFGIDEDSFGGFGEGTISFSDPVLIPEPQTGAFVFLSFLCYFIASRFVWNRSLHEGRH
jgi:hypothetical protein